MITTRNRDVADGLAKGSTPIHVGRFSLEESRLLLRQKLGWVEEISPDKTMDELLELLAYVPLAIAQAAAFINRNHVTIMRYLTTLQASESQQM